MPTVFAYIGDAVYAYLESDALATAIGYALEAVAVELVLNAAQQALTTKPKSGLGAGLEADYCGYGGSD